MFAISAWEALVVVGSGVLYVSCRVGGLYHRAWGLEVRFRGLSRFEV